MPALARCNSLSTKTVGGGKKQGASKMCLRQVRFGGLFMFLWLRLTADRSHELARLTSRDATSARACSWLAGAVGSLSSQLRYVQQILPWCQ